MNRGKNLTLVLGLAIPVVMVLLVAASIYVPPLFAPKPSYDFVYVVGDQHFRGQHYDVEDGRVTYHELAYEEKDRRSSPKLFVHDVRANRNRAVSLEDARRWRVNPGSVSPDGYEVVSGSSGYGLFPLFVGEARDYRTMYLQGHHASYRLQLDTSSSDSYWSRNIRVLGWIEPS